MSGKNGPEKPMLRRLITASSTYNKLHEEAEEEYRLRCDLQKKVTFLEWLVKEQEQFMLRNGISPQEFCDWLEQKERKIKESLH